MTENHPTNGKPTYGNVCLISARRLNRASTPTTHVRTLMAWLVMAAPLALSGCGWPTKESATSQTPPARQTVASPDVPSAPPAKINASTYYAAGQLHEREGNMAAAVEQYTRATEADPRYLPAWNRLGMVYDKLRMFDKAENAFIRALELSPGQAYIQNNVGFHYMLAGNFPKAESMLRAALAGRPNYVRASMNLAVVLTRTGRVDEAVDTFASVIPRDMAYYNVGVLCATDHRYDEARSAFASALAINPSSAETRTQLDAINRMSGGGADSTECAAAIRATQTLAASIGAGEETHDASEFVGAPSVSISQSPAGVAGENAWPMAKPPPASQPRAWRPMAGK